MTDTLTTEQRRATLRKWYEAKTARRPRDTFPWWAGSLMKTLRAEGKAVTVTRENELGDLVEAEQLFATNRAMLRAVAKDNKRRHKHDGVLVRKIDPDSDDPSLWPAYNAVLKPGQGASPRAKQRKKNKAKRERRGRR